MRRTKDYSFQDRQTIKISGFPAGFTKEYFNSIVSMHGDKPMHALRCEEDADRYFDTVHAWWPDSALVPEAPLSVERTDLCYAFDLLLLEREFHQLRLLIIRSPGRPSNKDETRIICKVHGC